MHWRWLRQALSPILLLLACGGISLALSKQHFDACTNASCNNSQLAQAPNLAVEKIQKLGEEITVKVLSKEFIGSGTLIKRQGQIYTVVTNAHVLRAGNPPYQIQTADGRIYQATAPSLVNKDNDLALLEFDSKNAYSVAALGDSSSLSVGEIVFVGGFASNSSKFIFTSGQVTLVLDKALEGGYQIGYTNNIRKGMSGAPLLNHRGEVVGINGLHKDPVWDAPDLYQDGSQPRKPLQDLITRSSMAVPIQTVIQSTANGVVNPKNLHSTQPKPAILNSQINMYTRTSEAPMQEQAEAAKNYILSQGKLK